jgi:AcrR family transcriptional regulator
VVDAAMALVEEHGLAELSMRRLAAELDAGTMSLYNHVSDKEDLLDGMVDRVLAPVRVSGGADWKEVVTTWATDTRRALLDHRALVPVVVSSERAAHLGRITAAVREALEAQGMAAARAALVVRVASRYLAGAVLLDAPRLRRRRTPRAALDATFAEGLEALLRGLDQAGPAARCTDTA